MSQLCWHGGRSSCAIAEQTGIPHESPQAIIFRNGEVVANTAPGAVGDRTSLRWSPEPKLRGSRSRDRRGKSIFSTLTSTV
ncbi:MAG: DUF2847 family protein [Bryobacterales bacterium]|nr:DUF2847 family protein [Bryobacterales bacterium]